MRKRIDKLENTKAFSLAELLIATIILMLSTLLVTTALQLGVNQFSRRTLQSEAEQLCTALATAVQDELSAATDITYNDQGEIEDFTSYKLGPMATISIGGNLVTRTLTGKDSRGMLTMDSAVTSSKGTGTYYPVSVASYEVDGNQYGSLVSAMSIYRDERGIHVDVRVYSNKETGDHYLSRRNFIVNPTGLASVGAAVPTVSGNTSTLEKYTVSFYPGSAGASASGMPPAQEVTSGGTASRPDSDPTCERYAFDGWYTAESGGEAYNFSTPVTSDVELFAHWKKYHTVTFDYNGGSGTPASVLVKDGETIGTIPTVAERDGYEFKGWYLSDTFDADILTENTFSFSTVITRDITLKAYWEPEKETYTVTFKFRNGKQNDEVHTNIIEGSSLAVPTPQAPTSNYTFAGWYISLDDAKDTSDTSRTPTIASGTSSVTVTETVTYYARWRKKAKGDSGEYDLSRKQNSKYSYKIEYDAINQTLRFWDYYQSNGKRVGSQNGKQIKDMSYARTAFNMSQNIWGSPSLKWTYDDEKKTFSATWHGTGISGTVYLMYEKNTISQLYIVDSTQTQYYYWPSQCNLSNNDDFDFSTVDD